MDTRFGLTLVVNHACNLRCTYCYTGEKVNRRMPANVAKRAIDRALASLPPDGALDLSFFGGEPLIEASLILELVEYAKARAGGRHVALAMTTNGTVDTPDAWAVMTLPDMRLAVSHDGLPEVHDRHRVTTDSHGTSPKVLATIKRLLDGGRELRVVMVVRPDSADRLPAGLDFLYRQGVRLFNPSLDLWATWTVSDGDRLQTAIQESAAWWSEKIPGCSVTWFDEKALRLTRARIAESARCGFGLGEIAVTPQGNLYPCERVVGADEPTNPMRLPGSIFDSDGFELAHSRTIPAVAECAPCGMRSVCNTSICRCSNYVRTGDVNRPDGLLCLLDQTCYRSVVDVLTARGKVPRTPHEVVP